MKKKYYMYAMMPVLALALGASTASAHGMGGMGFGGIGGKVPTAEEIIARQTNMFQEQATLLGISIDKVKAAWAEGKDLQTLATENGITKEQLAQKMQSAMQSRMKAELQTLVDKGVITQAQADSRLAFMQKRMTEGKKHAGKFRGSNFGL